MVDALDAGSLWVAIVAQACTKTENPRGGGEGERLIPAPSGTSTEKL